MRYGRRLAVSYRCDLGKKDAKTYVIESEKGGGEVGRRGIAREGGREGDERGMGGGVAAVWCTPPLTLSRTF